MVTVVGHQCHQRCPVSLCHPLTLVEAALKFLLKFPLLVVLRPPRYKLSDVPEESTLERDLESHADGVAVFSLKEAEEGRAVKYDHFHQRTKKEMLKPPMSRHVSEPGCAYHPVQLQEPHK